MFEIVKISIYLLSDNKGIIICLYCIRGFINLITRLVIMLITKRTIYIAVLSLICFSTEVYGQSYEERRQRLLQEYQNNRQNILDNYEQAREKINKRFSAILGQEWKLSGEMTIIHNPLRDIPSIPPQKATDKAPTPIIKKGETVHVLIESESPVPPMKITDNPKGVQTSLKSSFYGSTISIRFDKKSCSYLSSTRPNDIQALWDKFSSVGYSNLLYDFYEIRRTLDLCDWATLKLAQKVSEIVYDNNDSNESILLQSYLLCQCGLLTYFQLDQNNKLHLLIAADKHLDDYPFYDIDGTTMYQIDGTSLDSVTVPSAKFSGLVPFRMEISRPGSLNVEPYKTEKGATINANDISFYSDYPSFFDLKEPLSVFYYLAEASLSDEARNTLYPYLKSKMSGLNEVEAVHLLLIYFHKVFDYKTDEEAWGRERRFFPEETLYYPFSDCEDNAILFSRLVRDLLGLKTVLVFVPGHLCAAVKFNVDVPGDAEEVNGERYLICDPTYIGAAVGQAMSCWKEKKSTVIEL